MSLRSAADAPDQLLMVASDVTAQRAADEARLAAAIAQREMLIKEVHHRIKNNLQGVAGLLHQSASRHPEAAGVIAEAVSQVHAIAQVHGLLVGVTGPMRVRGVVEAIAASVQRMFGRTIHVEVNGPAPHRFALTEADSIPIALTVNELFTNAIKHSAPAPGEAATDIHCRVVCGESTVLISIANQGVLVPGFSLAGIPAGVSGLGLVRARCCRARARGWRWRSWATRSSARLELAPPAGGVAGGDLNGLPERLQPAPSPRGSVRDRRSPAAKTATPSTSPSTRPVPEAVDLQRSAAQRAVPAQPDAHRHAEAPERADHHQHRRQRHLVAAQRAHRDDLRRIEQLPERGEQQQVGRQGLDGGIGGCRRRGRMAQRDDGEHGQRREDQADADAAPGRVARAPRIARVPSACLRRAERMTNAEMPIEEHEDQRREVQRDLVGGDLHVAEAADEHGDAAERGHLGHAGAAHRQSQLEQPLLRLPRRPAPVAPEVVGLVGRRACRPGRQRRERDPHADAGRPAAAAPIAGAPR